MVGNSKRFTCFFKYRKFGNKFIINNAAFVTADKNAN